MTLRETAVRAAVVVVIAGVHVGVFFLLAYLARRADLRDAIAFGGLGAMALVLSLGMAALAAEDRIDDWHDEFSETNRQIRLDWTMILLSSGTGGVLGWVLAG